MINPELKLCGIPDICQLNLFPETGVADFVAFVQIDFGGGSPPFLFATGVN
jgi:hypothetical protein